MRALLFGIGILALGACSLLGGGPSVAPLDTDSIHRDLAFSTSPAGVSVPSGWQSWLFGPTKPPTEYLTEMDAGLGQVILHAHADRSASALLLPIDPKAEQPRYVSWRWRALGLVTGADISRAETEDAPVRLLLGFEGDHSKLSFRDQMFAERVKLLSNQDMPYAILMYVWTNTQPPETIVPNPHTGRIRMLVVDQGPDHVGAWQRYSRDIAADFRRTFGEDPGPLVMVGVMTDADNTPGKVDAEYGDIGLFRSRPATMPANVPALGPPGTNSSRVR